MIRVIIIDDEPLAISIVRENLLTHKNFEIVAECGNGFEGVKAIAQHKPDLIFLDVQMPKLTGFEMLELIDHPPAVIFTTAFDEYAIKAFELNAIDYLLKPFSAERFEKAISKWLRDEPVPPALSTLPGLNPERHDRIVVKLANNDIRIVPIQEVQYIEAYDDYVKIHTATERHIKKKTMAFYENTLPSATFLRVHRSYIVQLNQITRIELTSKDNHVAVLKSNIRIPVSKAGYGRLKELLGG